MNLDRIVGNTREWYILKDIRKLIIDMPCSNHRHHQPFRTHGNAHMGLHNSHKTKLTQHTYYMETSEI